MKFFCSMICNTAVALLLWSIPVTGSTGSAPDRPGHTPAQSPDFSDIPSSQTFDVATWNIEWFGHESRGPDDNELQYNNVIQIIDSLRPDLIGVQEIYNNSQFERLIEDLQDYDGFIAGYDGFEEGEPGLDVGFIYNTGVVTHHDDRLLGNRQSLNEYDWAYRYPLEFVFKVRIASTSYTMHAVVFHAKARSDQESYDRRLAASDQIKTGYFDQELLQVPLIFLGDYNDTVIGSTVDDDSPSPYKNFVDDPYYEVVSLPLEETGEASWPGTGSQYDASMFDHITINLLLSQQWMVGSEKVYRPSYIDNYISTTSDHYPVMARFDITGEATASEDLPESGSPATDLPFQTELKANYPNPFNPETTIPFRLAEAGRITLTIYNSIGQPVAQPVTGEFFNSGEHTIRFRASDLAGGLYLYKMELDNGSGFIRKMILLK